MSELRPLLAHTDILIMILIQYRAPKRADPDQPNALSLPSTGGCNLDVCACFVGFAWRGITGLHVSYCRPSGDILSTFSLLKQMTQIPENLLLARVSIQGHMHNPSVVNQG